MRYLVRDLETHSLNYGYEFLEGESRRAINAVGLEQSVGFLHDFSDYQTKQSLVYALEELFRWIVDLTVMQAFESGTLDLTSTSQETTTVTVSTWALREDS